MADETQSVTQQATAVLEAPQPAAEPTATPVQPTESVDTTPVDPLASLDELAKTETEADPNAAFEQFKDNPRFQEMVATEQIVQKAMQDSPYITEPAHVTNAVADATVLWGIIDGKVPAPTLLEAVKETNPAAFARMIPELAKYIQEQTGQPVVANAAGKEPSAVNDPAMQKLTEIEKRIAQREQQEQQAVLQKRVDAAGAKLQENVSKLVKDKWAPGTESRFMEAIQKGFAGKDEQLIQQIERGDYRGVERVVKKALSDEIKYVQSVNKWLIERKKTTLAAIPKQVAGGAPPSPAGAPKQEFDPRKLTEAAVAALQG
jgi:hypothetical protein